MKVKLTRAWIKDCYNNFCKMLNEGNNNFNLNYAIIKNKNILQDMIVKIDEYMSDLNKRRIDICEKHAKKDEKGNPIIVKGNYDIGKNPDFDKEIKKLSIERDNYLKTEIEFEGYQIMLNYIPKVALRGVYQECLMFFVVDEELQEYEEKGETKKIKIN